MSITSRLAFVFAICLASPASLLFGQENSSRDVQVSANGRTNVLFIAVDDLNDWVGCLAGHPQAVTPNIDRLAKLGVLFSNAHCQGPICGPSRSSLLSGLYPHTTGVYQQPTDKVLEKDEKHFAGKLLPEYFARHGYATTAVGKITHGYRGEVAFQNYGGSFEHFGPKPPNKKRFQYHLPDTPFSGTQTDWGAFPEYDEMMPDFKSASFAEKFLGKKHGKPFFLAVGFIRPHVPFYVPQKWFDDFPLEEVKTPAIQDDDLADVPRISRQVHEMPMYPGLAFLQADKNEQLKRCTQAYLACTKFVDHQIGRVIDALEKSDYADNTIVVLFSDHGYHLGEKDRVSKHSLWEESTRVPLVIVPGRTNSRVTFQSGAVSGQPVGLIDVYPTLLDLCGLPANPSNEGYSLKSLIEEPDSEWQFAALTTYARDCHSLRSERFRYIRYENGAEELYDHDVDPDEWDNLAELAKYREVIARFRLEVPAKSAKYHPSTSKRPVNAWFKEHLRRNGIE